MPAVPSVCTWHNKNVQVRAAFEVMLSNHFQILRALYVPALLGHKHRLEVCSHGLAGKQLKRPKDIQHLKAREQEESHSELRHGSTGVERQAGSYAALGFAANTE